MKDYQKSSHAVYELKYHFVWITKYRYKILVGEIKEGLKQILAGLCDRYDIGLLEGEIMPEHVHLCLSAPPKYSPSEIMGRLKGKSALEMLRQFPELRKKYYGQHIWGRGYS